MVTRRRRQSNHGSINKVIVGILIWSQACLHCDALIKLNRLMRYAGRYWRTFSKKKIVKGIFTKHFLSYLISVECCGCWKLYCCMALVWNGCKLLENKSLSLSSAASIIIEREEPTKPLWFKMLDDVILLYSIFLNEIETKLNFI